MNIRASTSARVIAAALLAMVLVGYGSTASASLVVTNYGTDSGNCGLPANPCRSISQAIENAVAGDTIWVGPGHYGDLNGDGNFDAPGSEHATVFRNNGGGDFTYNACVICIMKAVQIFSYDGVAVTTIQVGPNSISPTTVYIGADKVVFGSPGHGFTITGGNATGLVVDGLTAGGANVGGNVDLKDGTGFVINGPNPIGPLQGCPPGGCPGSFGEVLLYGNQAVGNGTGFLMVTLGLDQSGKDQVQYVFLDNLALGAGTGFSVVPGFFADCDDCDDVAFGARSVTVSHNVAADSGTGFALQSVDKVTDNVASDNSFAGFILTGLGTFTRNSATGNAGPGAILEFFLPNPGSNLGPPVTVNMVQNNFYGNDRNRPKQTLPNTVGVTSSAFPVSYDPGPSAHCGVLNVGEVVPPNRILGPFFLPPTPVTVPVAATGNFWGSAQGPQSNGAADAVGGACDQNGGVTTFKPFATSPFSIMPLQ